jgi:subtilisin family serine protease
MITACKDQPVSPVSTLATRASVVSDDTGTEGNYLVRFKSNAIPSNFASSVTSLGGEVIFAHSGVGIAAVSGLDASDAAAIAGMANVAAVDADAYTTLEAADASSVTSAESTPASPSNPSTAYFYQYQWNMRAISAPAAWSAGKLGSSTTRVGILDTGIDYLHPDLFGRVDLAASRSFLSAAENARVPAGFHTIADLNYHGTHVAATVVSNGLAAAGVTSKVQLVGLKVCAPGTAATGYSGTCPTSAVLSAILYSADIGLDVINMSLGGAFNRVDANAKGGFGPSFLATINQVMNYANKKGTAIVVSAGNEAWDIDHNGNGYSAYCNAAAVICVSATGPTGYVGAPFVNVANVDALAYYSNFGRSAISVAAPGGNAIPVYAACSGFTLHPALAGCRTRFYNPTTGAWSGSVVGLSGTSMAAPHVTGLAALIAGQVGHNPSQIAARLQQTADDLGQAGVDPAYGKGRINVARGAGVN